MKVGVITINGKAENVYKDNAGNYYYSKEVGGNKNKKQILDKIQAKQIKFDGMPSSSPFPTSPTNPQDALKFPTSPAGKNIINFTKDKTDTGKTINKNGVTYGVYQDKNGDYVISNGTSSTKLTNTEAKSVGLPVNENKSNENKSNGNKSTAAADVTNTSLNLPDYLSGATYGAVLPRLMSAAELADLYGLPYDYDYILGIYNEASDAKYRENIEKAKQIQENTLRNQVSLYYQYLDEIRAQRANAVNTGINRGAFAAQEVANYLAHQQQITDALSTSNQSIYDLYNEAATQRAQNKIDALNNYTSLGGNIMTAGGNIYNADIQRYAADLAAQSAVNSARITADAQIKASAIPYQVPGYTDYLNAYLNSLNSQTNLNNSQIKK